MMVDKLQPLLLFSDQRWQACLESFLDDVTRRESRGLVVDYRTILRLFFQGRDPEAVDHEAIESFCRRPTIYKSPPSGGTIKHRRKMLKLFYDHAVAYGIYQGTNPAHLPVVEKRTVHTLFDDPNWQACFDSFLLELHSRSGSRATVLNYSQILCRFFSDGRDPQRVTRADVSQFVYDETQTRGAKGHVPATGTINVRCAALRSFFKFASDFTITQDGHPEPLFRLANPTAGIRAGQPARVHKSLSLAEVKRFFSVIPQDDSLISLRDRSCFWTFLLTCRRRSELANLRWGDIEFEVGLGSL